MRARALPALAALAWLLAAPFPAAAQNPYEAVADSPHNFSGSTVMREVCAGCHVTAPGPASAEDLLLSTSPLWGGGEGGTFEVGAEAAGGAASPDTSGRCLECHDGVLATGVHEGSTRGLAERGGTRPPDHPVRMRYPRDVSGTFVVSTPLPQNRQYWSVPDIRAGRLTLPTGPTSPYQAATGSDPVALTFALVRVRDGRVHCESCHNPHSNRTPPFLRQMPPDLCLVCHNK